MARNKSPMAQEKHIDLDKRLFNEKFLPYLGVVKSHEVYYGGSGSGKSNFVGDKLAYQMTMYGGRNLMCLRRQKTDCVASCFPEIQRGIRKLKLGEYWDTVLSPQILLRNRVNGNQILFEGVDDVDDIKSIKFYSDKNEEEGNLTDVWYEEADAEPDAKAIRELDRRLRDSNVQTRIILSFNPVSRQSWLFEYVEKELRGVVGDIVKTCYDTINEEVLILHSTWRDNQFLPSSYGEKLERTKYTDPYDYMVYSLGEWGVTGRTVFDSNKIAKRLGELDGVRYEQSYFVYGKDEKGFPLKDTEKLIINEEGSIKIFEHPKVGRPYVVSIDTAGEGSDFYVAQVMDNITEEQVAIFRDNGDPDECVKQCYLLSRYYNEALVCPEINFDSWIVKFLGIMEYDHIYRRESKADSRRIRKEDKLGWRTQPDNRQMMLTELVDWSNAPGNMSKINDADTLNEMLTFTRQQRRNKGIFWGAENGAHDDTIISLAIFLQAREQQAAYILPDKKRLEGFYYLDELEEMLEEGKIDRIMMQEYINSNSHLRKETRRGSRYAKII